MQFRLNGPVLLLNLALFVEGITPVNDKRIMNLPA